MLNRWRMTARQPFGNTMPRVAGRWMNCVHGMRTADMQAAGHDDLQLLDDPAL